MLCSYQTCGTNTRVNAAMAIWLTAKAGAQATLPRPMLAEVDNHLCSGDTSAMSIYATGSRQDHNTTARQTIAFPGMMALLSQ